MVETAHQCMRAEPKASLVANEVLPFANLTFIHVHQSTADPLLAVILLFLPMNILVYVAKKFHR